MSRQSLKRFSETLESVPRPIRLKVLLLLVLVVAAVGLFLTCKDVMKDNSKMLKFIRNEQSLQQRFQSLKADEAAFRRCVADLSKNPDREKLKSQYITRLLEIIRAGNLKVDSYRSEVEEKDGFVLFKYNITIIGTFLDTLAFFQKLPRQAPVVYVDQYKISRHLETQVHMGLLLEVVGTAL